jgi:hypothetical protein
LTIGYIVRSAISSAEIVRRLMPASRALSSISFSISGSGVGVREPIS